MDRMKALHNLAHGEAVEKGANLAEIMDIGMTALMLHNTLHGRSTDDDGPDFDKSEMDGLFGAMNKALYGETSEDANDRPPETAESLLDQLKALFTKNEDAPGEASADILQFTSTPIEGEDIVKSFDEDLGLVTAVILRPNVTDLHGDIYDAAEVEKACFNFNTRCRNTNVQHEKMADFDMVQSYISPVDCDLGSGQILKGDWLGTMYIDPIKHDEVWKDVKEGKFTGFSIGCKASVEAIAA